MLQARRADVAELVDASDLKSVGAKAPCRFESGRRHQQFQRVTILFGSLFEPLQALSHCIATENLPVDLAAKFIFSYRGPDSGPGGILLVELLPFAVLAHVHDHLRG